MYVLSTLIFLIAAGACLYALSGRAWKAGGALRLVVAIGFLARAFAGQALFWISYLRLPIAESLQIGDGLWFFAIDAQIYTRIASTAASGGMIDIASLARTQPSVTYAQALSLFSLLMGDVVAVSLLLNLFCYLGACVIVIRWSEATPGSHRAACIAIAALSLSPSGILWSLQPLKDTYFQFLIVAFAGACFVWQRAWRLERFSAIFWWCVAAMVALLYLITGVRWYAALMMLVATLVFMLLVSASLQRRRLLAAGAGLVLVLALSRVFLLIAEPYLPPKVARAVRLREAPAQLASQLAEQLESTRAGFERSGGSTAIRTVAPPAALPAPKPPAPLASTAPAPTPQPTEAAPPAPPAVVAPKSAPVAVPKSAPVAAPKPAPVAAPKPAPVAAPKSAPVAAPKPAPVAVPKPALVAAPKPAPVADPKPAPVVARAKESPNTADGPVVTPPGPARSVSPVAAPASPRVSAPRPAEPVAAAAQPPSPEPPSRVRKFLTGAAATVLPRMVATRLGLVQIGGSGALWLFAEIDTIFFDVILLAALWFVLAHFRLLRPSNALFWLMVGFTVMNAAGLIYTVTNFGTLFRLRSMIYTGVALIPLALATCPVRRPAETAPAESRTENGEAIPAVVTSP